MSSENRTPADGELSVKLFDGRVVSGSRYLSYYIRRFQWNATYDQVSPQSLDVITWSDRDLANAIGARRKREFWEPLVGKSIKGIGRGWDLIRMSDSDWQKYQDLMRSILDGLLGFKGIGLGSLTKALHRKRPSFIPICDSVLVVALGTHAGAEAEDMIECMGNLRRVGRENNATLESLRRATNIGGGELTELRILEILHWLEWGPFRPGDEEVTNGTRFLC